MKIENTQRFIIGDICMRWRELFVTDTHVFAGMVLKSDECFDTRNFIGKFVDEVKRNSRPVSLVVWRRCVLVCGTENPVAAIVKALEMRFVIHIQRSKDENSEADAKS